MGCHTYIKKREFENFVQMTDCSHLSIRLSDQILHITKACNYLEVIGSLSSIRNILNISFLVSISKQTYLLDHDGCQDSG